MAMLNNQMVTVIIPNFLGVVTTPPKESLDDS